MWTFQRRKRLPKEHGLYFVLNQSDAVVYLGKATGAGVYGRWGGTHHKVEKIVLCCGEDFKIFCLTFPRLNQDKLAIAEEALIWALKPRLNRVSSSYAKSFVEVFDFVSTTGQVSTETVKRYIEGQKNK